MKKFLALLCLCSFAILSFAQDNKNEIAIIPQPVKIVANTGHFTLPKNVIIEAPANDALKETISFLKDRLSIPTGMSVTVKNAISPASTIKLLLNKKADAEIGKEGYHLLVPPNNITIKAN